MNQQIVAAIIGISGMLFVILMMLYEIKKDKKNAESRK